MSLTKTTELLRRALSAELYRAAHASLASNGAWIATEIVQGIGPTVRRYRGPTQGPTPGRLSRLHVSAVPVVVRERRVGTRVTLYQAYAGGTGSREFLSETRGIVALELLEAGAMLLATG